MDRKHEQAECSRARADIAHARKVHADLMPYLENVIDANLIDAFTMLLALADALESYVNVYEQTQYQREVRRVRRAKN